MIDGVKVLSEELVKVETFNAGLAMTAFLIIVFICFALGVLFSCVEDDGIFLVAITIFGLIFGVLFGCTVGAENQLEVGSYVAYKVTLSDDVLMKEFNSTYEVLDIEGDVYTVKYK